MQTIGRFVDALAQQHGDRRALISASQRVSYAELAAESDRVATALARLGASKGTRVGVLLPNRAEWLACAFGALKLGAIVVPLNTLWRTPELAYALRHADVTVLIAASRFLNHAYGDLLRGICPGLDDATQPLLSPQLPALRQVIMLGDERPAAAHDFQVLLNAVGTRSDAWLEAVQADVERRTRRRSSSPPEPRRRPKAWCIRMPACCRRQAMWRIDWV